jgi:hypothetical protein
MRKQKAYEATATAAVLFEAIKGLTALSFFGSRHSLASLFGEPDPQHPDELVRVRYDGSTFEFSYYPYSGLPEFSRDAAEGEQIAQEVHARLIAAGVRKP